MHFKIYFDTIIKDLMVSITQKSWNFLKCFYCSKTYPVFYCLNGISNHISILIGTGNIVLFGIVSFQNLSFKQELSW